MTTVPVVYHPVLVNSNQRLAYRLMEKKTMTHSLIRFFLITNSPNLASHTSLLQFFLITAVNVEHRTFSHSLEVSTKIKQ